jgi:tellurite resistance protein TerC
MPSNSPAILGLRSLYFVLASMIGYFRYLKVGLSLVLVYIGVKMLVDIWGWKISTNVSLGIVVGIIAVSIMVSVVAARWSRRENQAETHQRD